MRHRVALAAAVASFALPSLAFALAQRTFVSAQFGSDANPCTLALPCRSFGAAISQAIPAGEVVALDSGGYGPVVITKSITLQAPGGVYAGIHQGAGDGITISAAPSDSVTIKGLTIDASTNGILVTSAGVVHVENTVVHGTSYGIRVAGGVNLSLLDSTIRDTNLGLVVDNPGGDVRLWIDNTRFVRSANRAVKIDANASVVVDGAMTRSTLVENNFGFEASLATTAGTPALDFTIDSCTFNGALNASNNAGIYVLRTSPSISATVRVSNSTVAGYESGIAANGGAVVLSRGNNTIRHNSSCDLCAGSATYTAN